MACTLASGRYLGIVVQVPQFRGTPAATHLHTTAQVPWNRLEPRRIPIYLLADLLAYLLALWARSSHPKIHSAPPSPSPI